MYLKAFINLVGVLLVVHVTGCVSPDSARDGSQDKAPAINAEITTKDAVDAAIKFGGETLIKVKELIGARKEWRTVEKDLEALLLDKADDLGEAELINVVHLYQSGASKASIDVFQKLLGGDRQIQRVLAWNLASNLPSKEMAAAMDSEFTKRVNAGEEKEFLLPQMAQAVQANRMMNAYTLLRLGLMENGDDDFAKAMISIAPQRVADDFLTYLGRASVEELRQINQVTVNLYTCLVILRYFTINPVPLSHRDFPHLFLYSVSRNQGLADLAALVIERLIAENRDAVALTLARLPAWVQVAYIENAQQRKSPQLGYFLEHLREVTTHDEVTEEIDEIR